MEKTNKQTPVQIILPAGAGAAHRLPLVWTPLSAILLAGGSLITLYAVWNSKVLPLWQAVLALLLGMASCAAAQRLKQRETLALLLPLALWPVLLLLAGPANIWAGLLQWLNEIITRWNLVNNGGAVLLAAAQLPGAAAAFTLAGALLCGQLAWYLAAERKISLCAAWCVLCLAVQLVGDTFVLPAAALLVCGLLGTAFSDRGCGVPVRTVMLALFCMAVTAAASIFLPNLRLLSIENARAATEQAVHTLRYGADTLPLGDLEKAAELNTGTDTLLTVRSEQEKALYLRAYTGSVYQNGRWETMPDSAYGGSNAGMLDWLKERNFDPMTQVAEYYRLTDSENPELNTIAVQNEGASRYFCYLPLSLENTNTALLKEKEEEMLLSRGLLGARQYTVQERSDARPAELTVAADWVTDPQTEEQQQYSEAEAAYRAFVYDQYTDLDEESNALMNELFWNDYETDHEGVYSALTRIRKVLQQQVSYTQTPDLAPEGEDPVRWFLTQSHSGNAVQYASAAVMALRARGIPARYVEGYCLKSDDLAANDGQAAVTGKDAHAWAEAYFDGVGWLPLDTVPGFYLDTAALQQLVSQPTTANKTAALQRGDRGAKLTNTQGEGTRVSDPQQVMQSIAMAMLGAVAVLVIVLTLTIGVLEILRVVRIRRTQKRYADADAEHKALMLEEKMFRLLHLWGIDTALGWKTQETDALLAEKVPEVHPGEYAAACALIEKCVYGGIPPEPFEERMMSSLMQKLVRPQTSRSLWQRLKQRYAMTLL